MCVQFELQDIKPSKLVVEGVSKSFSARGKTVQALDRVSLDVNEGEFVCLVGPSGCGKSTLLNLIAGLEQPDQGSMMTDAERALWSKLRGRRFEGFKFRSQWTLGRCVARTTWMPTCRRRMWPRRSRRRKNSSMPVDSSILPA